MKKNIQGIYEDIVVKEYTKNNISGSLGNKWSNITTILINNFIIIINLMKKSPASIYK